MSHVGKVSVGRSIVVVLTIKHILNVAISIYRCSPNTVKTPVIIQGFHNPVLVSEYQAKQRRGVSVKQHLVTFLHIESNTATTISHTIAPFTDCASHGIGGACQYLVILPRCNQIACPHHIFLGLLHLAVQSLNGTLNITTAQVRSIGEVIGYVLRISRQNQVKGVSAYPSIIDIPPQLYLPSISASLDWLDVYGVMVAIKLRVSGGA